MNRRIFFQTALSATPLLIAQGKKYKTALIGSGWWGMNIMREALASGECSAVALADPDPSQMDKAGAEIVKLSSDQPRRYKDYREMLKKERPDIVIVATPDHWHALPTIDAVKSGAHVYVEKPISHTIDEGKAMVKAAREADRVVQVGLHRRVSPHPITGMQFLKSGKVGKIGMVRTFAHAAGGPGTKSPDSDPPPGMDWDLWLGPARSDRSTRRFTRGDFGSFSIMRMARWAIGACIGWIRFSGGPKKRIPSRCTRPPAGSCARIRPMRPTRRLSHTNSRPSAVRGNSGIMRPTMQSST